MSGDVLEVRALGPVEFRWDGRPIDVDRPLERALAVRLALDRGAPVPDDMLARDLWGEVELNRPAERLRVLASRLRSDLGPAARALRRERGGYALDATVVDLDAAELALAAVRAAPDKAAVTAAAQTYLSQWRGPALADLRATPFAQAEGERLDRVRLEVQVDDLAARSVIGHAGAAAVELERLAASNPLHERLWCELALALYRTGRQADALARMSRLRATLADELGVDPGPETARVELRILRQDPELIPVNSPTVQQLSGVRLTRQGSRFVGRERDRDEVADALRSPGVVTLIGAPGVGKTRLALEVSCKAQEGGRPVAWVDLAPLQEPDAVGAAVINASAVEASSEDAMPRVADALNGALLVIDNAEHLVDAVAELLTELTRLARGLSVLVTSQRPLLIAGEIVRSVPPLSPDAAASLFAERSGTLPDARVDRICAAVDNLPLGIELAAGLTRVLTIDQLDARIGDRMHLLAGGRRGLGTRHTSLRAALDWSYRLLDSSAQSVLRRLAAFAGGCTLEAAEYVVAGDDIAPGDIPPLLAELAERSLIVVVRDDPPRFHLLESVRAHAIECLDEAGEDEVVRARHLAWCRGFVGRHDVQGDDGAAELAAVFTEWPNLLAALESAPGTPRAAEALRLALALDDAWMFRGLYGQACRHYQALVDAPGLTDGERARALSNYGFASTLLGDTDAAARLLDRADTLADLAGEDELRMRVLYHRGITAIEAGYPSDAFAMLQEGERIADKLGRTRSVSAFLDVAATAHCYAGDASLAAEIIHRANELDRETGYEHGLLRGLVNEASILVAGGHLESAVERAAEAEEHAVRLEDLIALAVVRSVEGRVALANGQHDKAIALFRAALAHVGADAHHTDAQLFRLDLADALLRREEVVEAGRLVTAVLSATPDRGVAWLAAQPAVAILAAHDGDAPLAREILDEAEAEYIRREFRWQPVIERLRRARATVAGLESGA